MENKKLSKKGSSRSMQKVLVRIMGACVVLLAGAVVAVLLTMSPKDKSKDTPNNMDDLNAYTWEQYEALTPEEKALFPDRFENMDAYNAWYERVNPENRNEAMLPTVNLNGKKPEEFTWEDYQKLAPEEQMLFPDSFDSMDAYNAWYERVNPENRNEAAVPTVSLNGKKPEEFTWEDYQKLAPEEQMLFPDSFDSMDEYNTWYEQVNPENRNEAPVPTVNLNGKKPEEFTWEDYQKLTPEEQMLLPDAFPSFEAYEKWYDRICPD